MAKHLTPSERAAIVARYVETANASQVAREFGVSDMTVMRSVARANELRKVELHARAVAKAIRKARQSLARKVDTIDLYLLKHSQHDPDGVPDLEPRDLAAVINASSGVLSRLLDADANIETKQLNALTRKLKRKEIALAELRIAAGGVEKHEVTVAASDARAALAAALADGTGTTVASGASAGAVEPDRGSGKRAPR